MAKIYLIPDIKQIQQSMDLLKEYHGAFEYNDFFDPMVLSDIKRQAEIINVYSRFRSDFSEDTLHGAFFDVIVHSTDPLMREVAKTRIEQSLEIAKEMGVRAVVFHTNLLYGFRDQAYLDYWLAANETLFKRLLHQYPDQEIYMENMFDGEPDMLFRISECFADEPGFGLCLDYAHAVLYGKDTGEWVQELCSRIRHVHINDNDLKDDLHLAIGKGQIDWQVFSKQVKGCGNEVSILIETKGVKAQRASLEYMKKQGIFPWGRGVGWI